LRFCACLRALTRRARGGAFPRKWFWAQCNAFEGEPDLAVRRFRLRFRLRFSFLS
jgi:hypothetical protein